VFKDQPEKDPLLVTTGQGRILACAACRRRITSSAARIAVNGSHEHECENPHGYRYKIGCFAHAEGVVALGNASTYWSWFPGYSWQVQNCAGCGVLLGWLFAREGSRFWGLIVESLVEIEEQA
jgi:hypothetical protein